MKDGVVTTSGGNSACPAPTVFASSFPCALHCLPLNLSLYLCTVCRTCSQSLSVTRRSPPPPLQGFRQLKLMRGPKATLGFVEFDDTGSAITAHNAQQNAMLNSRWGGGTGG